MADKQTVIGSDTQITGEVRSEGALEVRGRIEGKISVAETLTISNGAIIQADLDARVIEISGNSQFSEPLYLPAARLLGVQRALAKPIRAAHRASLARVARNFCRNICQGFASGVYLD